MGVHRVPEARRDPAQLALEPLVFERLDLAAISTDEVMVVMAVRPYGLETGNAVTEVDTTQEALRGEEVEDAVDARNADARPGRTDAVVRLLRRQAAVLVLQMLHHRAARAAAAVAGTSEAVERVLRPGGDDT